MRIGAVLLGRLSSARLPGKVLTEVAGRPLAAHVLARVEQVDGLDGVVFATSDDAGDDPIADWARGAGIGVFRGSLDDVRGRVIACADEHGFDAIARVNADSPWIDPELLSRAVVHASDGSHDLVTNVLERTYPYGVSAEVATVAALRRAEELDPGPDAAEHVTKTIYTHPEAFSILNLRAEPPVAPGLRLTVDTPADLERFETLVERFGDRTPRVETEELVAALAKLDA
jgi:spore coat polysaccharide biosynthesis protein SpsF